MLPFFAGERAPYWNSALRGAFDGLDLAHDRRTILRAAFESVVFGVYAVYDVVRELARDAERLLLTGGLTKAPLVRSLLADVFGLPAVQPHEQEASAFGAALLAAQAVGLIDDASAAARAAGYDAPTTAERSARADLPRRVRALPPPHRRALPADALGTQRVAPGRRREERVQRIPEAARGRSREPASARSPG